MSTQDGLKDGLQNVPIHTSSGLAFKARPQDANSSSAGSSTSLSAGRTIHGSLIKKGTRASTDDTKKNQARAFSSPETNTKTTQALELRGEKIANIAKKSDVAKSLAQNNLTATQQLTKNLRTHLHSLRQSSYKQHRMGYHDEVFS